MVSCLELEVLPPESNWDFNAPILVLDNVFMRFDFVVVETVFVDETAAILGEPDGDSNIEILSDMGFLVLLTLAMVSVFVSSI